ncbi:MAG: hypothetical protein ACXWCO_00680 [Caldimonas sp.]
MKLVALLASVGLLFSAACASAEPATVIYNADGTKCNFNGTTGGGGVNCQGAGGGGGGGAVTVADGADATQGAKADAKSNATDATPATAMQVFKEISFMEQNPAPRAVTNGGTFAVQDATVEGAITAAKMQINNSQVGGSAISVNTGPPAAGTQRVVQAQSTDTIAGSAPGTAGSPSSQVITVQGPTSGGTAIPVSGNISCSNCSGGGGGGVYPGIPAGAVKNIVTCSATTTTPVACGSAPGAGKSIHIKGWQCNNLSAVSPMQVLFNDTASTATGLPSNGPGIPITDFGPLDLATNTAPTIAPSVTPTSGSVGCTLDTYITTP